ncbi:MAG: PAS domain-containing protein [Betaproteobacteria bacterium]|nr:PAS domain-containing protein [Betaproteobacteria bacterium]
MPAGAERGAGSPDSGFAFERHLARKGPSWPERLIAGSEPSRERLRSFRVLGAARLLMGSILLGWFVLNVLSGGGGQPGIAVSALYVLLVLGQWLISLRTGRGFGWQVLSAVLCDLVAFTLLQWLAGSTENELVLSYTLPVLAAGVWGTLRFSLATAATVTLLLLARALVGPGGWGFGGELQVVASGFVGAAYFAMGTLAWQLSQRLVRQEQRARLSEIRAKRQLAINRHVLLEHPDGVLVLDSRLRVEAANPAAANLLGMPGSPDELAPGAWDLSHPALAVLGDAVRRHAHGEPMQFESIDGVRLQARVQPLRHLPGGPAYVVFVQDMRDIGNQIQQDKLAALGRLVAALAHEIRNPLGAIAHANELAAEPGLSEAQRSRMSELIAQNVDRLNRIVEDVLDLGRAGARSPVELQPLRLLRELVAENEADAPGRIVLEAEDPQATLVFDPQQLRRVIVNLLGNAQRFASRQPGAIRIVLRGGPQLREIAVANDGPVVAPSLRTQIFEPFFTTDSRGTGLGLYICQELCSRYGTRLFYRVVQRGQSHGEFVIGVIAQPEPVREDAAAPRQRA